MNELKAIVDELETLSNKIDPRLIERTATRVSESSRVYVVGVGRVMLALQAFAKRLNHLGISTYCVGDINEPAFRPGDVLVIGSGSGVSRVPLVIGQLAKQLGGFVVYIGAAPESPIGSLADDIIAIPAPSKIAAGAVESIQPMTSLFEQALFIFLDSVVLHIWAGLDESARRVAESRHATLE